MSVVKTEHLKPVERKHKAVKTLCSLMLIFISIAPLGVGVFSPISSFAQSGAKAGARIDATRITVGDAARLFIEVQNNPSVGRVEWAAIPDSFNNLEVTEKGKIDTIKQGGFVTYRQRLVITGFDSGMFKVPSFVFSIVPNSGAPYTVQTDTFNLLVQTIAVDTTKGFKGIKGIVYVKSSWQDYLPYIIGGVLLLILAVAAIIYFAKRKKVEVPKPAGPVESLQDKTLRLLGELDARQLWQKNQVKQYYVELTDIVRNYIEQRFNTPAMELTTDELLYKAQLLKDMQPYQSSLSVILQTADLAKFAKAQPLPQEHTGAMDKAKEFVNSSRPVIIDLPTETTP